MLLDGEIHILENTINGHYGSKNKFNLFFLNILWGMSDIFIMKSLLITILIYLLITSEQIFDF